jgi:hypothetical protein
MIAVKLPLAGSARAATPKTLAGCEILYKDIMQD